MKTGASMWSDSICQGATDRLRGPVWTTTASSRRSSGPRRNEPSSSWRRPSLAKRTDPGFGGAAGLVSTAAGGGAATDLGLTRSNSQSVHPIAPAAAAATKVATSAGSADRFGGSGR